MDRIIWKWDPGGKFTVASCYKLLSQTGIRTSGLGRLVNSKFHQQYAFSLG